jgi:hypothetical protein
MCANSLWGNLEGIEKIKTPKSILEEQGSFLTSSMDGILEGIVLTEQWGAQNFSITLKIVAPALNNYSYQILRVYHPLKLYPLTISSDFLSSNVECKNENEYLETLEKILSSEGVKNVIQILMSQVK